MEFIQQNLLLVLLALGSGGALLAMTVRRPGGRSSVTPTQATLLINREDAQIIDVRGSDEYVSGHLPDSRNIPLEQLEERAGELEKFKSTPLILVCQTGTRSEGPASSLKNSALPGLTAWKVVSLDGAPRGCRSRRVPKNECHAARVHVFDGGLPVLRACRKPAAGAGRDGN